MQRAQILNDDYPLGAETRHPDNFDDAQYDACYCRTAPVIDANGNDIAAEIIVPLRQTKTSYAYMYEGDHIGEAHYGFVWRTRVLRPVEKPGGETVWQVTSKVCAVKETIIKKYRNRRSSENPIHEICALQHLKRSHEADLANEARQQGIAQLSAEEMRFRYEETISNKNVVMPLDILYDERKIYCVMPLYEGRDLFCYIGKRAFSEEEVRFLIKGILNGLETLQKADICHRDISPENIMINERGRPIIIDFGFSLKIPYIGNQRSLMTRCLIRPNGAQGKQYYISPEIYENREPFDGHAIDLWAVGPIIHMLCTKLSLWEIPSLDNNIFSFVSRGQFAQLVQHWEASNETYRLSEDLVDLLQGMFNYDAPKRLSLQQVQNHPWMQNPTLEPWVIRYEE